MGYSTHPKGLSYRKALLIEFKIHECFGPLGFEIGKNMLIVAGVTIIFQELLGSFTDDKENTTAQKKQWDDVAFFKKTTILRGQVTIFRGTEYATSS